VAASREALLGLFREPEEVARALDGLRAVGFRGRELEVLSDSPYPEGAFGEEPVRHRLYVFPLIGALVGFGLGLLVTIGTQLSYPLVTGGKPILAIPPMINIIFEGTMLGAILFTVCGVLFESRLPHLGRVPYDPRISEGYLGVLVTRADGRFDTAERALRRAGAVDVVRDEE
jgi:ActD protein